MTTGKKVLAISIGFVAIATTVVVAIKEINRKRRNKILTVRGQELGKEIFTEQ